jgi:tetratricopeptide (TPR) repeat protein
VVRSVGHEDWEPTETSFNEAHDNRVTKPLARSPANLKKGQSYMQLHDHTPLETSYLSASLSERARLLCALAQQQEEAGDFDAAGLTLNEFWRGIGVRPRLEGLGETARAELLLRAGTLSGWIGSAQQISGAQEIAKDLITESANLFVELGLSERVPEARIDLAICYLREGGLDEARVTLKQVLDQLGDQESEQKLRALLNLAVVEKRSTRYQDALRLHNHAAPLFERSDNHSLRGKFHNEFATVLKNLALAENRGDYIDRAFIEYAAATFHAEQAGNKRFLALVENNVGFLFVRLSRITEAHGHLDRARSLFVTLKDKGRVAQVDETRARAFLVESRIAEAETLIRSVVRTLEEGDELSLLAEALTTQGTVMARLGRHQQAFGTLKKAMEVGEQGGDLDSSGIAALTMVEELRAYLPTTELRSYYRNAESLLSQSQHSGIQFRLGECARRILAAENVGDIGFKTEFAAAAEDSNANENGRHAVDSEKPAVAEPWEACTLEEAVLRYEGDLIKRALEASGGSVTRAARMLGITHQGLAFILNGRHSSLLSVRTPIRRRRRSIIRYR